MREKERDMEGKRMRGKEKMRDRESEREKTKEKSVIAETKDT